MFPLFGGIIADSVWGKYKTILYLSVVYCLGNIVNAVLSLTTAPTLLRAPVFSPAPCAAVQRPRPQQRLSRRLLRRPLPHRSRQGLQPQYLYNCFGLINFAPGTGGIKPCVSSFGGDQVSPPNFTAGICIQLSPAAVQQNARKYAANVLLRLLFCHQRRQVEPQIHC